jgi:hypothetical protein
VPGARVTPQTALGHVVRFGWRVAGLQKK